MLNAGDIDFMADAQDEIYTMRERPITFIQVAKVYDDFTGQPIGEEEIPHATKAVITETSIRSKDGSHYVADGIEYEQGDLKIDVKIESIAEIKDEIVRVEFDGNKYELLGGDRKGIGVRNRVEYIGREIA